MKNATIEINASESELVYNIYIEEDKKGYLYMFRIGDTGFATDSKEQTLEKVQLDLEMNKSEVESLLFKDKNAVQEFLNGYISLEKIGVELLNKCSSDVFAKCSAVDHIIEKYSLATNGNMECSNAVRNYCDELNKYSVKY